MVNQSEASICPDWPIRNYNDTPMISKWYPNDIPVISHWYPNDIRYSVIALSGYYIISYLLSVIPYPLSVICYPLSLIPPLSHWEYGYTVVSKLFWGLTFSLTYLHKLEGKEAILASNEWKVTLQINLSCIKIIKCFILSNFLAHFW